MRNQQSNTFFLTFSQGNSNMSAILALEIRVRQVFSFLASVTASVFVNFLLYLQSLLTELQFSQVILTLVMLDPTHPQVQSNFFFQKFCFQTLFKVPKKQTRAKLQLTFYFFQNWIRNTLLPAVNKR